MKQRLRISIVGTTDVPETMTRTGTVGIGKKEVAQRVRLIGWRPRDNEDQSWSVDRQYSWNLHTLILNGITSILPDSPTSSSSCQMGNLFVQRCDLNVYSDMLGTPDVFW